MTRGQALIEKLGGRLAGLRGRITPDAEMDKITWFRAGGLTEALFQPADEEDLAAFLRAVPEEIPLTIVGVGSNLLVRDGGIPGFVVRLSAKGFGDAAVVAPNRIRARTALPDKRLAAVAYEAGLGGFHFYHGIPGAIGGALRMNAGANGVETRERVKGGDVTNRWAANVRMKRVDMAATNRVRIFNPFTFQVIEYRKVPESMPTGLPR